MRLANLEGRATIVTDDGIIDVATASNGAFSTSLAKCLGQLDKLAAWYRSSQPAPNDLISIEALASDSRLGAIVNPQQVFAIGLNYRRHAAETGKDVPKEPMVFTKFPSAVCGPNDPVPIPGKSTDYEGELVVVIGSTLRNVSVEDALTGVAGYCVGQDYSEREWQYRNTPPQFSLGKSFKNFAPMGPWITTADEIPNPNDLGLTTRVNGEIMQDSNTSDMVFSVAELIAYLSSVCELRRGDVIFTGTPEGVGQARTPPFFLKPGDEVVTTIERLGTIRNVAVAP
ncbi:MAG TPA: fumarylacetoacetate hydrolase family protein [Acidimicrobiales bacterium]|nr:fumarylacetoacetate hydrolase family protein [Acidimicrobiales bacterium]